nr:hypothetical protein [uncultured Lichenicoccus sp.]
MGVALIAWGRFIIAGQRVTVPAPSTDPDAPWLWDFIAGEAAALRQVGFTAIQVPPASKAQGGAGRGCDGYGVFDLRDLGSKPQQDSLPTRYGTAEQLRRMVACCHAAGLDVYLDVVLHQVIGENGGPGVFRYLGADGETLNGRGAMHPGCFRGDTGNQDPVPPFRPEDAVPAPGDDFPFGREKVYQNCQPLRYTTEDALDYGDWLFRTTGADGMRFDDAKGTWAPFVGEFLRGRAMARHFAYAEFFDGDPGLLEAWATAAPISSRALVEDFTLHWALQAACESGNPRCLAGAGYIARNPFLACTFVDNPDTDTSPGEQIVSSKLLAYAYLLTAEGYPFVYGKDYYGSEVWEGAYGLKPWIDNLVWIHETLAAGGTVTRWLDDSVIVSERTGAPGLLSALNFDTWNARTVTCQTGFGPDVGLHDYTGRHADIRTASDGTATFTIPSNAYQSGQSYLCFSRSGQGPAPVPVARATTQSFFGADDLDIPALGNSSLSVGRVFSDGGRPVSMELQMGAGWAAGASVVLEIVDPDGMLLGSRTIRHGDETPPLLVRPHQAGWCTIRLAGVGLAGVVPFIATVSYEAPLHFEKV